MSHALWIAKDLCWWASVEMFPGRVFFQATTVAVATALLAHNVDAAVLTWRGGNLIGFVNQVTLLCWVSSFTIWCMGEVFWEKYEGDTTGDFTFLTKKPRHWLFPSVVGELGADDRHVLLLRVLGDLRLRRASAGAGRRG